MPLPIGISLGNEQVCSAVFQDKPVAIVNQLGSRSTAAYVAFSETEVVVGDTAKLISVKRPREVIHSIMLLLANLDTPQELQARKLGFTVIEEKGKVVGVETVPGMDPDAAPARHTLQDVLEKLLSHVKGEAEAYLGGQVSSCVLALPDAVCSNSDAVEIALRAAKAAGMTTLRVVRTAVAALMGIGHTKDGTVAVVDAGATGIGASVVDIRHGMMNVRHASMADVGCIDMDAALAKHFAEEFRRKSKIDLDDDKRGRRRLLAACENTKKMLTQQAQGRVEVEALSQGVDFHSAITRVRFETTIQPILRAVTDMLEACFAACEVHDSLSAIVLVGGGGNIPKMRSLLEDYNTEVVCPPAPEEVAALGAAIQAAHQDVGLPMASIWSTAAGGRAGGPADRYGVRSEIQYLTKSIGIKTSRGVQEVVKQGTLLPHDTKLTFPISDGAGAYVEVVEDESTSICRLALRNTSQEATAVTVLFHISAEGSLKVTLTDKKGNEVVATVKATTDDDEDDEGNSPDED